MKLRYCRSLVLFKNCNDQKCPNSRFRDRVWSTFNQRPKYSMLFRKTSIYEWRPFDTKYSLYIPINIALNVKQTRSHLKQTFNIKSQFENFHFELPAPLITYVREHCIDVKSNKPKKYFGFVFIKSNSGCCK